MKRIRCIKWAEDKASFHFVFKSKVKSEVYYSEKTGLKALDNFLNRDEVSLVKFYQIREEILSESNLPVTEDHFDFFYSLATGKSRREGMFVK